MASPGASDDASCSGADLHVPVAGSTRKLKLRCRRPQPHELATRHPVCWNIRHVQAEGDRLNRRAKRTLEPTARRRTDKFQRYLGLLILVEHLRDIRIKLGKLRKVRKFGTQYADAAGSTHFAGILLAQLIIEGSNFAHRRQRLFVAVAHWIEQDRAGPGRAPRDHQRGEWRLWPLGSGVGEVGGV